MTMPADLASLSDLELEEMLWDLRHGHSGAIQDVYGCDKCREALRINAILRHRRVEQQAAATRRALG